MMVDQKKFSSESHVAIWVGNHTTEDDLDEYLGDGGFSEDFCFELDDDMAPEFSVEPGPIPLRNLVDGFTCSEQFDEEFLTRSLELGIFKASSILVFHGMSYSPEGLPVSKEPAMRFIGNFQFDGFDGES